MKAILIVTMLVLGGCNISIQQIEQCEALCLSNKGIAWVSLVNNPYCGCKNGARFNK